MKTCPLCSTAFPNQQSTCPTDGALLIESRDLEPGTVIRGKYRIVRLLGHGGMGTVYLAEHILLGQQRALKFISSELSQDARFLKRFRHEAQAAIKLRHPNVVEVVDLDQAEDGTPYIAMEYVEGEDLRQALAAGAFPVERALAIARGIAQGLGAAHAKGIVHRDVKPENILLAGGNGAQETPKLLDFGIAAIQESATAVSRTRGLLLTPPYAAPEQWQGMASEQLDGRADLYALGGVLYEMLTGQTCFHAQNTEGWMHRHLHEEPQPPSRLRPELANWQGLDALVLRLLDKEREERPKDAAELLGLLDAVRLVPSDGYQETEIDGRAPRLGQKIAEENPKTARLWGIWLGLSAAGLILAVVAVWFISQPSNKPAISAVHSTSLDQPRPEKAANLKPSSPNPGVSRGTKPEYLEEPKPIVQKPDIAEIKKRAEALENQKRYPEAIPLIDQACNAGDGEACGAMANLYHLGHGVEKDDSRAADFYTKSCNEGSKVSCVNLGYMYSKGIGVARDSSRAVSLYTKACDAGLGEACSLLGLSYDKGEGVAQDRPHALFFYSKACDAGSGVGCSNLGAVYYLGIYGEKDYPRAAALYSKACDDNTAEGCFMLGAMNRDGSGVGKNPEKAELLFGKSCSLGFQQGCEEAKKLR